MIEAIRGYYAYSQWATERLLAAAERLTPEQWLAPQNAGRGSIRDTLAHFIGTQRGWLAWWDGSLPPLQAYGYKLEGSDVPDMAAMRAAWAAMEENTAAFIAGLTDADLERVYGIDVPQGPRFELALWKMMLHVANHNTQHRSEAAAMMTAFDCSPGDLDALFFFGPFGPGAAN